MIQKHVIENINFQYGLEWGKTEDTCSGPLLDDTVKSAYERPPLSVI